MFIIVIFHSGNHAIYICETLIKKGVPAEVTSTPCTIAKGGCSYCIRIAPEFLEVVLKTAKELGVRITDVYRMTPMLSRYKFEKISETVLM